MLFLPLLFHFNQHLTEFSSLSSQVCYRGLLQTLRANPSLKANIHISGTLITALKWLDPEPLHLIRDGLKAKQFEIVGSTFAQNVPYATDDWDNVRQIELHKQVIEDTFGVTPTAFWNPERCWRQSLVPIIVGAGYKTITIEDHILEQSGGTQPVLYRTQQGEHSLAVVRDDEKLKHLFNFAAWFGDTRPLEDYLLPFLKPSDAPADAYLAYAEDAEAMGLWGYTHGVDPRETWEHLGVLLKTLTTHENITPLLFSDIPTPSEDLSPIRDGAAAWMNASLAQSGLPYHEDGYTDWFDFNTRSPKLKQFRTFYTDLRKPLQRAEKTLKRDASRKIYQLGLHNYLTHQYEFGCVGIGGETYRGWVGANAARVMDAALSLADLFKEGTDPIQFTVIDEINHDGVEEWLHLDEPNLLITSPIGGRLLYWINLQNGQLLIGNPSTVVPGKYEGDSIPPETRLHPNFWLPTTTPRPKSRTERPPTRMGKYLPAWVWENYPHPVTLAVQNSQHTGETPYLTAQQGAFCDEIWLDYSPVFNRREKMEVEGSREAIRFTKKLDSTLTLRKKFSIEKNSLSVAYTFTNRGEQPRQIQIKTTSELALDYAALLQHGRAALDFLPDQPAVVNPLTGETLIVHSDIAANEVSRVPAMLGLTVGLGFEFCVRPNEPFKYSIQMVRAEKSSDNITTQPV